jgi:hypothetical protein
MLDFCLTIPYGGILMLGGLVGLLVSGSVASGVTGLGLGGALTGIGWMSYVRPSPRPGGRLTAQALQQDYLDNKSKKFKSANYSFTVVSLILTVIVLLVMGDRYQETQKMFPAGIVSALSFFMVVFYLYKLSSNDVGAHAERASKVKD